MLERIEITETPNWQSVLKPKPYYLQHNRYDDKYYFSYEFSNDKIYVPEKEAKEIFDAIQKLDYIKILQEASHILGCDGESTIISLSAGMNYLTVSLWEFHSLEFEETKKLHSIYDKITDLAFKVGFCYLAYKDSPYPKIYLDDNQ